MIYKVENIVAHVRARTLEIAKHGAVEMEGVRSSIGGAVQLGDRTGRKRRPFCLHSWHGGPSMH